jgi:two-component system phosphate regulon response regulator PhoB
VVKPFSLREVVLRIRKILARGEKQAASAILKAGPLILDLDAHTARLDDQFLELTATEFRLLTYLLRHRGRVQTREMLLDRVWGYSFEGYARTIDTHIRRLRKKMGAAQNLIETVRGVGYRFQAQE